MNKLSCLVLFAGIVLFSSSCQKKPLPPLYKTYIHIAHTRAAANPHMYDKVEQLDYSPYDMIWLGGDMANETSLDEETMINVDTTFDLGSENTLWALGNHDYASLERVEAYTKRSPYYSYHKNGITFLVLDTQDSLSSILGKQKELVNNVLDTISESSFLIVLHHKLIWMHDHPTLSGQIGNVANGGFGNCFFCINPNNFNSDVYPRLVEIKKKGIEVICIGGDIGFKTDEFEHTTDEDIHFLASGINFGIEENKALIFTHDVNNQTMSWEYQTMEEL